MNCLCCGKPLEKPNDTGWHEACVKRFFGVSGFPDIDMGDKALEVLAETTTQKGFTVAGVQKKLSLHLSSQGRSSRLTLVDYPTGYLLKPQVKEFEHLPEAEHLVMEMADASGISTVPHALIQKNGIYAYITKRVDRIFDEVGVHKLAMEDFCQLDHRLTADKYKGSYERCAKIIQKYSSQSGLDMAEFYFRLLFCFVTGNSDMHLKNFSLIETKEASGTYMLSPAYDLLPVNILMENDKEEFALTMNGKKQNLRKKDFLIFAKECELPEKAAARMMDKMVSLKSKYLDLCAQSLLPDSLKKRFATLMEKRCEVLQPRP